MVKFRPIELRFAAIPSLQRVYFYTMSEKGDEQVAVIFVFSSIQVLAEHT